jgi:ABC-type ATPase with predicted acetyltransferase domain
MECRRDRRAQRLGKSTIAGELFGASLVAGHEWPRDKSIIDGFPEKMSIKDIVGLLSSVGFSSPPAWMRPFHVLSNGQQFRVNLARTLAEATIDKRIKVVDEYSSVVDRTVRRSARCGGGENRAAVWAAVHRGHVSL